MPAERRGLLKMSDSHPSYPHDGGLFKTAAAAGQQIAAAYEETDYARAMRTIMALADAANGYVENAAPWSLKKDPSQAIKLQEVCTIVLNLFRQLSIYLAPVLPRLAEQCSKLLRDPIVGWDQSQSPLVGTSIAKFEHMLQRLKIEDGQAMIESGKQAPLATEPTPGGDSGAAAGAWSDTDEALLAEPLAETCSIDDFAKIDLRVARVIAAGTCSRRQKTIETNTQFGRRSSANRLRWHQSRIRAREVSRTIGGHGG